METLTTLYVVLGWGIIYKDSKLFPEQQLNRSPLIHLNGIVHIVGW